MKIHLTGLGWANKNFMKKFFLAVVAVVLISGFAYAQSYQEVVYLKNGSVIRGVVIEQVPGISLKIQTGDGSIFAYSMADVEKITKEAPRNVTRLGMSSGYTPSGLRSGYRGMADFAHTFGVGVFSTPRVEISNVHGYQFNEYFFLGGGVGAHYYYQAEAIELPIFVDFRVDFLNRSVTPYFDLRAGYTVFEETGFYINPTAGARFSVGPKCAINVGFGYTAQFVKYDDYYYSGSENLGGLTLRVGVEF